MKFSFGIITSGTEPDRVLQIIDSIKQQERLKSENYEIIVVGGQNLLPNDPSVRFIPFDETIKPLWITRKKNIIFQQAKYNNIAIGHDYIIYRPNWYQGFLQFGESWDVCMAKIAKLDGTRMRDHVLWNTPPGIPPNRHTIQWLSYDNESCKKYQYISGAWYCVKKQMALNHPLDETKCHSDSEDVEWSYRCRSWWNLRMNENSMVQFIKHKDSDDHPPKTKEFLWKPEYEITV